MNKVVQCAGCQKTFEIWTFSLGMSRLTVYPCSTCPIVLAFELPYDRAAPNPFKKFRCECGGEYRNDSPFHCPHCNAQITMDALKSQINWRGTPDGIPGVCVTKCIDDFGREYEHMRREHAG
jgi:hypothetical protein